MIISLVQFHVDPPLSAAEAMAKFHKTAPSYRGLKNMVRKDYIYGDSGRVVGGILIWSSKQAAEQWFNDAWKQRVTEHYGIAPQLTWYDAPLTIDNSQDRTEEKAAS